MIRRIIMLPLLAAMAISVSATDCYVSPDVVANGTYTCRGLSFTGGTTAFSSINAALTQADNVTAIHVAPGVYAEDITVTTSGITFYGANAYGDERSETRNAEESVITGHISILTAGDIIINGFRFSDTCRISATKSDDSNQTAGFTFAYNIIDPVNVPGQDSAVLSATRFDQVNITANRFILGNVTADGIQLGEIAERTDITHNRFTDGARTVCISRTDGTIGITHNRFTAANESAISMQYMGAGSASISVCDNEFDQCKALTGVYPVMLDQGTGTTHVTATSPSTFTFNYNVIRNFTPAVNADYNYFVKADDCAPFTVDTRFNRCDNSLTAFGTTPPLWENGPQRYFAGSTGYFDFDRCQADYYMTPVGKPQHQYQLKTNYAAQSFDIDTETGDIYYIQVEGSGDGVLPLRVTRYLFRDDNTTGRQYMYLTNASHGANMSVFRHEGRVWIATGGASIFDGHCKPQSSVLLPFVSGATADCGSGKTSFTYNGKTYKIIQFLNQWNKNGCYPAIDVDNRLFCETHTASSGKVRFAVYDLDDVLANGSKASLIKAIIIQKGSNKYHNDNPAYADIVDMDDGFNTSGWSMQGFDISGDMIYRHEGVGLHNNVAYSFCGEYIPTIMQHCFNWRDSVFVHRKPILNSKILSAPNGEPEGVKIVRDRDGRPHMIVGIVWGVPSSRTSTLVDFAPPAEGFTYTVPVGTLSAQTVPSVYVTSALKPQTSTAKIGLRNITGHTSATISGPDAACFEAGAAVRSGIYVQADRIAVTFTPDGSKRTYKATMRVSAPGADDCLIPLTGTYSGPLSDITEITTDSAQKEIIGYYDVNGRRINAPSKSGITIIRYADGSADKVIM